MKQSLEDQRKWEKEGMPPKSNQVILTSKGN